MAPLQKLTTLYVSNNRIKNWEEVAKCSQLADLTTVLFIGNPIYTLPTKQENWPMVVRKIPNIQTVDGAMVTAALRAEAEALEWARFTSTDEQMKKEASLKNEQDLPQSTIPRMNETTKPKVAKHSILNKNT